MNINDYLKQLDYEKAKLLELIDKEGVTLETDMVGESWDSLDLYPINYPPQEFTVREAHKDDYSGYTEVGDNDTSNQPRHKVVVFKY